MSKLEEIHGLPEPYCLFTGKINVQIVNGKPHMWWTGGEVIGVSYDLLKGRHNEGAILTMGEYKVKVLKDYPELGLIMCERHW